ncbi:MAG: hotdog fold thioesterase [Bacteroidia bacterium]|nr:hotdog fold thioesterase [Bacteroidia bacterium]MDW8334217.1 hotdog fold thioesterase [Bacteroidia bacterium]
MFKIKATPEEMNAQVGDNMVSYLGIEVTAVGEDWIMARMPVVNRTKQPFGLLHGGASVALAESVGSLAANLCVDLNRFYCVGLEINANHLRAVTDGWVHATARPLHLGRTTQVWDVRIHDDAGRLVCVSRLTMAVVERK